MKLVAHPLVSLVLGLLFGVGTGAAVFWHEGRIIVAAERERLVALEPVRPEKPWDFWTIEIEALAAELKELEATLTLREQTVAAREERLAADLRELEKTRGQIERMQAAVTEGMLQFEAEEVKNLKALAKTYADLTPKAAVGIMQKMEEATVVKILHLMKSDRVSPILEEMGASADPGLVQRAAQLTDRLRLVNSAEVLP